MPNLLPQSFLLTLSFCFLTCSCSIISTESFESPPPAAVNAPAQTQLKSLEIYLNRANTQQSEFEHFKVIGSHLFKECGTVHAAKQVVVEQAVLDLEAQDQNTINQLALESYQALVSQPITFDKPGKGQNFYDAGRAEVSIKTVDGDQKVVTALDSITAASTTQEQSLKTLIEKTRLLAGSLCNNPSFYGFYKK